MLIDDPVINDITRQVISAAIEVHRTLGPGLLESVYRQSLGIELASRDLVTATEHAVPLSYKGSKLDACYRVDLIVANRVLVEIKSVDVVLPVHEAQTLTYLRLTGCDARF